MPSSRCIDCNKSNHYRNTRGSKLSDRRCECGGKLEAIGGCHTLAGEHPLQPQTMTYKSEWFEGPYFNADVNRKGEYFVYNDGYWHKVENPVIARRKEAPSVGIGYSHNQGWNLMDMQ